LAYTAQNTERVETFISEKILLDPLRWTKPRRIFVCSMTDLFGEWVSDEQLDRIFAVMALAPQHTFLVLTKRAERMREYLSAPKILSRLAQALPGRGIVGYSPWPLLNVWLGVSVEDQRRADERIPHLLATPAAARWLSIEPMLEAIDLSWLPQTGTEELPGHYLRDKGISWIVVGGESGPHARPFDLEWGRSLIRQCRAASVLVFVKQIGSKPVNGQGNGYPVYDAKGGDMSEWPADMRIREFPA
jgi:protein gp37